MKLLINVEAAKSIKAVMQFIESQNTNGSGNRWFYKLQRYLLEIIQVNQSLPLCKYPPFREKKLHCIIYKDWVVAFKNEKDKCVIMAFVYGTNLNY